MLMQMRMIINKITNKNLRCPYAALTRRFVANDGVIKNRGLGMYPAFLTALTNYGRYNQGNNTNKFN